MRVAVRAIPRGLFRRKRMVVGFAALERKRGMAAEGCGETSADDVPERQDSRPFTRPLLRVRQHQFTGERRIEPEVINLNTVPSMALFEAILRGHEDKTWLGGSFHYRVGEAGLEKFVLTQDKDGIDAEALGSLVIREFVARTKEALPTESAGP
jgi:hypothetical protein